MPIIGPSSYLPTTNEFLAHWSLVNATLGANPLTLDQGAVTLATLTSLRDDLMAQRASVVERINTVGFVSGSVLESREALLVRLEQLLGRIRANAPNSKWTRMLPQQPSAGAALVQFQDAFTDAAHVWELWNDEMVGFLLPDAYSQVMFAADIAALATLSNSLSAAEKAVQSARGNRNVIQDKIRAILRDYRQAVPSFLMPGDALLTSLPRLSPERGKTPQPVAVEASFDAATNEGVLVWSASTEDDVVRYSIRWAPGDEAEDYNTEDEEVQSSVDVDEPRVFRTTKGLLLPGGVSLFRVYVINDTDNEKGSDTVVVTRPET